MSENDNMKNESFEEKARKIAEEKEKQGMAFEKMQDMSFENVHDQSIPQNDGVDYNDPYLKQAENIKKMTGKESLGRVNVKGREDNEFESADMLLGWHNIYTDDLPSGGIFYPAGVKIQLRSAKVNEIRHWSTLNERDLFDIEDKLNYILQNCSRLSVDGRILSWKDIREEDKIFILLKIRDLTFPEPEARLQFKKKCPDCSTEMTIEIKPDNFELNEIPDNISKYYSEDERCFIIQTKSSGVIRMCPPSVGVMKVVADYIDNKRRNDEGWDKAWLQIVAYLQTDWRNFKEKDIFDGEVDFKGWNTTKYNVVYGLAEKMKIGVKPNIKQICPECGAEVTTKVDFPGGIKSLFMLPDISGELL